MRSPLPSNIMTLLAAVRLRPSPPAFVLMRNTSVSLIDVDNRSKRELFVCEDEKTLRSRINERKLTHFEMRLPTIALTNAQSLGEIRYAHTALRKQMLTFEMLVSTRWGNR
jgi:hypothetical protein